MRLFLTTALWIVIVGVAAFIGSQFMPDQWYWSLRKPPLTPPPFVFGPVWTTLYLMMAIAASIVWRRTGLSVAIGLFLAQLVLNALWSWLFFGRHQAGIALADIILMWVAIAATIAVFSRHSRPAAWLMVPYLAWVSFATYLNAGIVVLN